jgi:hypothetical protein
MGLYEGETPLYFMISDGNVEMVKWLRDRHVRCAWDRLGPLGEEGGARDG